VDYTEKKQQLEQALAQAQEQVAMWANNVQRTLGALALLAELSGSGEEAEPTGEGEQDG